MINTRLLGPQRDCQPSDYSSLDQHSEPAGTTQVERESRQCHETSTALNPDEFRESRNRRSRAASGVFQDGARPNREFLCFICAETKRRGHTVRVKWVGGVF